MKRLNTTNHTEEKVRTGILLNEKNVDAILLYQFSDSDLTTVRIRTEDTNSNGLIVGSSYMPYNAVTPPRWTLQRTQHMLGKLRHKQSG